MILKSNGYDKVGVKASSIFLLYFIDNFNREAKSMRVLIGTTYIGDISSMIGRLWDLPFLHFIRLLIE